MKPPPASTALPVAPVQRWLSPVQRFLHVESSSGILLLACTAVALLVANSPYGAAFLGFWKIPVTLTIGSWTGTMTLGHLFIDDGLMTIFFFVVGLEIKRELAIGELRDPKKALLPVVAALGGMVVPALVYLALQAGQPGHRGWAIPMATDIAFVVGFLALFGPRVPFGLKITLLSLAIVDDLGAVLIIAVVFSKGLSWLALLGAACGFGLVVWLARIGVRAVSVYVVVGTAIWVAMLASGVHPTVAGVLLGLLTPTAVWVNPQALDAVIAEYKADGAVVERLEFAAREAVSPLQRLETTLHPWVAFVIMPLFALANAGVVLQPQAVADPVALAVAAGLFLGKPLAIVLFSFVAVRLGWTRLPDGVSWPVFCGGACLAGIGFTMALFLTSLAFPDVPEREAAAKIGTLIGSLFSALVGAVILLGTLRKQGN